MSVDHGATMRSLRASTQSSWSPTGCPPTLRRWRIGRLAVMPRASRRDGWPVCERLSSATSMPARLGARQIGHECVCLVARPAARRRAGALHGDQLRPGDQVIVGLAADPHVRAAWTPRGARSTPTRPGGCGCLLGQAAHHGRQSLDCRANRELLQQGLIRNVTPWSVRVKPSECAVMHDREALTSCVVCGLILSRLGPGVVSARNVLTGERRFGGGYRPGC